MSMGVVMDYHLPPTVGDRLRVIRVTRRIEHNRWGQTTGNYHRNQRVHQVSFMVLLAIMAISGIVLLAT
jgi:hypothetical protein